MFEAESRTEQWPSFKLFDECSPGDLIRMRLNVSEDRTEWALKGRFDGSPPLVPVFVLPRVSTEPPYFLDIAGNVALREQLPLLSYGRHYDFAPDHLGPCDLISGPISEAIGSFILSDSERFICGWLRSKSVKIYYNIDTGLVQDSLPGQARRAAFKQWMLWLDIPDEERRDEERRIRIIDYGSASDAPTPGDL
jgi:hypothetical protein